MRYILTLIVIIILMAQPLFALAHATPVTYVPQASQVLPQAPNQIKIQFSEHVEPQASNIVVFAPDGKRINSDDGVVDPTNKHWYATKLQDGDKGTYIVSWQVISADDGHFTKGAYSFSVGQPSVKTSQTVSTFQIVHSSTLLESLSIGSELIGQAMLLGVLIVFAYVARPLKRRLKEFMASEQVFLWRMDILMIIGGVLVIIGTASYLVLKSYELVRFEQLAFAQAFTNFLHTSAAMVSVYRGILALLFIIVWWLARKRITNATRYTRPEGLLLLMVVAMEFGRAWISHAAASLFHPTLSVIINFVHLVFKDVWVGGLIALVFLFAPMVRRIKKPAIVGFILASFSNLANIAIAVGGASGVYIVWLHLKDFSNLFTTDWGKGFLLLNMVAGILLFMRLYHEFIIERNLSVNSKTKPYALNPEPSSLGLTLPFEMWTGIVLLLLTGMLIITTPALEQKSLLQKEATSQGMNITLTEHPYQDNQMLVTVQDSASGKQVALNGLEVAISNADKGIKSLPVSLEQRFVGGYSFSQQAFSLPGNWQLTIIAHPSQGYDATATFNLVYPQEILNKRIDPANPPFTLFTLIMIAAALGAILVGIGLYLLSNRRRRYFLSRLDEVSSQPMLLKQTGAWAFALIIFGALFHVAGVTTHGGHPALIASNFERLCIKNGHFWHESVAMRQGQVLSSQAYPGCMTGHSFAAESHFSDEREYRYFTRSAQSVATLTTTPQIPTTHGQTTLIFHITNEQGYPIQELTADHDRLLHVMIIPKDFADFAHIHPEDLGPINADTLKNAIFTLSYTFPRAGDYLVAADYTVRAQAFSQTFPIHVTGEPQQAPAQIINRSNQQKIAGYAVTFGVVPKNPRARSISQINYHIEKDGKPVQTLQPYLAAPMHFAIVRDDLLQFIHTHGLLPISFMDSLFGANIHQQHGILPDHFGPDIQGTITPPTPGGYELFGEFKDQGKVITTHFHIDVQ